MSEAHPTTAMSSASEDATHPVHAPEMTTSEFDVSPSVDGPHEDAPGSPPGAPPRRTSLARLEEEGEVAADYLEELLDIADIDGDIDIDVEDDRAVVSIVAEGADVASLRRLAGPDGSVLEALQELTRLAVQARTGERSRLVLDVGEYRARRREQLQRLAQDVLARVRRDAVPVSLEPMNPFERKVVHDVVAAAGLRSDSEGVEPDRYVVVHPS